MPDKAEFISRRPSYIIMLNAPPGAGKTHQAMTFPKVYVIGCDPSGLDILKQRRNERLLDNLVYYEYLRNESEAELRKVFDEKAKADDHTSIYGCIAHAKELAKKGEVETIVVDNVNYFVDMRWQYVNEYEQKKSKKTGEVDTQGMYRDLGLYLSRFFGGNLFTMATRNDLNVVITSHIRRETPQTVEGTSERAGKVNKESDISPLIEGGFRARIEGMVGASLYLEHGRKKDEKGNMIMEYKAHTQKSPGLGTVLLAKNRCDLVSPLILTNKSLYEELTKATNTNPITTNIAKGAIN